MFRFAMVIAAATLLALGSLEAQTAVKPGTHVRVVRSTPSDSASDSVVEGTWVSQSGGGILLDGPAGTVTVPLASVDRVDVRIARSRPGLILADAGTGLLIGAVGGALVGPLFTSECVSATNDIKAQGSCAGQLAFNQDARLRGAIVFGVAGAILGTVVGEIAGRERWRQVSWEVASGGASGVHVGATIRF